MCYPHFLLHGLHSDNATGVASIIRRNGRIIHETRAAREHIEEQIFPRQLNDEYRLSRESTISDDYWGISAAIKSKELGDEYITKAGFFLDMSARELYIIHVQGRKPVTGDGDRKYYHEAAGKLQMSPRVAVLRETLRIAEEIEFKKVRMIKAYEHPFALEEHRGYQANHDRDARKAGLCEETDVYLEKTLVS